jgi:hypothetical protein
VYLYVLGGDPGLGTGVNAAAGLMAALGSCPTGGNFLSGTSPISYIVVNEVSTVAAAYAMAGFATDATHVGSSGTALAQTGIANAFANAANLETIGTGVALATTPTGNGTVPQAEIDTLANILAACVNSNGAGSACTTLFANAESSGTAATDTATAAINIAHNPGANVATLYGLSTANPPFGSALTAQPNDFTVALSFAGGGLKESLSIAIDGSGDAWAANYSSSSVSEFSSAGVALSPSTGYTGGALAAPYSIAIDNSGNAWVASGGGAGVSKFSSAGVGTAYAGGGSVNPVSVAIDGLGAIWLTSGNSVSKFSNAGVALSPSTGYTGGGLERDWSIAVDGTGNAWIANRGNFGLSEFSNSGTPLSPSTGFTGGGYVPGLETIAIDGSGDIWVPDYESYPTPGVSEFSDSGIALSPSTGYTGGGLINAVSVAIDGSGNAWVANSSNGTVSEFSNTGKALSPSTGYVFVGNGTWSIAIDGSGNVWTTNIISNTLSELIGAATPVITPICAGLPATPTTDGSSKLGTRP